ncbi:hypothetical protein N7504_000837 [Penicillium tannophilum]|nr:hypothetical protein N7504_000837 [Penicillium tannophilum]
MARRAPLNEPEKVIQVILEDGGVILTGFADPADVDKVNSDSAPYTKVNDDRALHFLPQQTTRCTRLFGRSETAREIWLQQKPFLTIINHFLRTVSIPYEGDKQDQFSTDAILSQAVTMEIGFGGQEQLLHRDDLIWQQSHTCQEETGYKLGSDVGMGLLVPGVDTVEENGATLFVPRSHLWSDDRRPKREEASAVELKKGEALLFLSSAVHAGGANKTHVRRPMHGFFFCRSYIRQEENQYVWWTREEVQKWSLEAQKMAGYVLDGPFMGHTNHHNPIDLFRASDPTIKDEME